MTKRIKTIKLSEKQFEEVKEELELPYMLYRSETHNNENCKCGAWCVYLEGLGYFTLINFCDESSNCPSGKLWHVSDQAFIYDKSIRSECFDTSDMSILYKVDDEQVSTLRNIANLSLREYFLFDEYGRKI